MALSPRLDLRQSQSLVMTPQLQQAIKLLALSNLEIETFIGEALENNPLLESGEMRSVEREAPPESEEPQLRDASPGDGDQALDIDPDALDRDRDTGDWSAHPAGGGRDDELPDVGERADDEPTLAEHLDAQVGAAAQSRRTEFVARHIVGLLDEAGYLAAPLREVAGDLDVPLSCVEEALSVVQSLDPTGVGARSLGECLALQAIEADRYDPCMRRLIDNLDLVARGDFARLRRMCGVDDEDFADMLAELRSYDPKPGLKFGGSARDPVVPDILIAPAGEGWDIRLNEATLPRLVVNRSYYVELREGCTDKTSKSWLGEKLADANWLIKALDQRAKTILKVAAALVKAQDGFFRKGVSELKPLTLKAIADDIEMHESTVSRVTSNKYLHCERGTFELKYFFSSGVARTAASGEGAEGEGAVSAEAVKAQIRALCDAEDPAQVLSDDKLVELLREKGYDLARRTVAKYREAIGIGSSVQRRRQKKLQRVG